MLVKPRAGCERISSTTRAAASLSPRCVSAFAELSKATTDRSSLRIEKASTAAATAARARFFPDMDSEVSIMRTTSVRRASRRAVIQSPGSGYSLPRMFSRVSSSSSSPRNGSSRGSRTMRRAGWMGPTSSCALRSTHRVASRRAYARRLGSVISQEVAERFSATAQPSSCSSVSWNAEASRRRALAGAAPALPPEEVSSQAGAGALPSVSRAVPGGRVSFFLRSR